MNNAAKDPEEQANMKKFLVTYLAPASVVAE